MNTNDTTMTIEHASPAHGSVWVFETNIKRAEDIAAIAQLLGNDRRIRKWNVDTADCDHVLRIEAVELQPEEIIERVVKAGYRCEELPD